MGRSKLGTCQGCRWMDYTEPGYKEAGYAVCKRWPPEFVPSKGYANEQPDIDGAEYTTCGEWEPIEGRVCGTCELFVLSDGADGPCDGHCEIKMRATCLLDTCPAWRWRGDE